MGPGLPKRLAHAGTLAFTAFWLLATSRRQEPAVECFVPLQGRTLEVTLGAPLAPQPGDGPSCREIDGLKPGSVLRATLKRSATPPNIGGGSEVCWSYVPTSLEGPVAISKVEGDEPSRQYATGLFEAHSAFERPGPECAGDHSLVLMMAGAFRAGMRAEPARASPTEPWRVRRGVVVKPGSACSFKFPDGYCTDTFEVKRIAHVF